MLFLLLFLSILFLFVTLYPFCYFIFVSLLLLFCIFVTLLFYNRYVFLNNKLFLYCRSYSW
ncbi:hypothetical protein C2G38_2117602, partial [Gigaspora rosea]